MKTDRKKHSANNGNTRSEAGENIEAVDRVMQLQNYLGDIRGIYSHRITQFLTQNYARRMLGIESCE